MTNQDSKPSSQGELDGSQLKKLLVELGPLVVFFTVNSQAHRVISDPKHAIFWGTGAFMVATLIALIVSRSLFGRVPVMPLVSGFFVIIFGGLTLLLQDELFIKMKPTIVNALFAAALFAGLMFERPLMKYLFGEVFHLTEKGWTILTWRWACFFVFLAVLNELVWRSFSTDFWVSFKVFGVMPITIVFAALQVGLLKRYEQR